METKFGLQWALDRCNKTEGFLRDGEKELLYKFAFDKPKRTDVVEIGSWKSKSTVLLASACISSLNGIVWAIDPHKKPDGLDIKPAYDLWREQNVNDTFDDFISNIRKHEIDDAVLPIRLTSQDAYIYLKERVPHLEIGFMFIDGCHQRDFVEKDFDLFSPMVVKGGCIAFHDSSPGNLDYAEGPAIVAQNRLIDSKLYERCDRFKSLTYGYKK